VPWPAGDTLAARGITVHFGGVAALDGVDFDLTQGEILGLIGPNGAGKSTLINVLSGFQRPRRGSVCLDGRDVTGRSPAMIAQLGAVRSFQGARLFTELTVLENVEVAALTGGRSRRRAERLAADLLRQFGLTAMAAMRAGTLPYGLERRLSLARALAVGPRFLLLDEPAAGLDELEGQALRETLARLPGEHGCGVLVVEHDMTIIMSLCPRLHVLVGGRTMAVGPADRVRENPEVITAYLGQPT
jgi:branched-chain amino acid transport system ATP-binding protein